MRSSPITSLQYISIYLSIYIRLSRWCSMYLGLALQQFRTELPDYPNITSDSCSKSCVEKVTFFRRIDKRLVQSIPWHLQRVLLSFWIQRYSFPRLEYKQSTKIPVCMTKWIYSFPKMIWMKVNVTSELVLEPIIKSQGVGIINTKNVKFLGIWIS